MIEIRFMVHAMQKMFKARIHAMRERQIKDGGPLFDDDRPPVPMKSIHRISEANLTKRHLHALMERNERGGLQDNEKLDKAEDNLAKAIARFLKICPSEEMVLRIVDRVINWISEDVYVRRKGL